MRSTVIIFLFLTGACSGKRVLTQHKASSSPDTRAQDGDEELVRALATLLASSSPASAFQFPGARNAPNKAAVGGRRQVLQLPFLFGAASLLSSPTAGKAEESAEAALAVAEPAPAPPPPPPPAPPPPPKLSKAEQLCPAPNFPVGYKGVMPSGTKFEVLEQGCNPIKTLCGRAKPGIQVGIKFIGKVKSTGQIIDNIPLDKKDVYYYRVGIKQLIPAIDEAVLDMFPGEVRQMDIPASAGFGSVGRKQSAGVARIRPNEDLEYTLQLFQVPGKDPAPEDELTEKDWLEACDYLREKGWKSF